MAATTSSTPSIIEVSTTMPILDNLPTFTPSDRLIFRPLSPSDLEALHSIRRQPEPMLALGATKPDNDLNETRKYFEQSEKSNFVRFGIFLKNLDGNEGELIGEGGVQIRNTNWPSPSWSSPYYILKKEHWRVHYFSSKNHYKDYDEEGITVAIMLLIDIGIPESESIDGLAKLN